MKSSTPRSRKRTRTLPSPQTEPLIPIRLDLDLDGHRRLQDTFTWPLGETELTPTLFAAQMCGDLNLPESARDDIAKAITEQISTYVPPPQVQPDASECRHVIRLDMRIGSVVIRDQFEWDLNCELNSPEAFAEMLGCDLGLGMDHVAAVAHAVREQLVELAEFRDKRQKCAVIEEQRCVRGGAEVGMWEPTVECLTAEERERLERKERREARLMRRNRGKGGGYARGAGGGGRRRSASRN